MRVDSINSCFKFELLLIPEYKTFLNIEKTPNRKKHSKHRTFFHWRNSCSLKKEKEIWYNYKLFPIDRRKFIECSQIICLKKMSTLEPYFLKFLSK